MKIKEYKIISVIISSKYTVEDFQNQCNKLFVEGWDSLGDIRTIICHVKDNRETIETIHITREFVKYDKTKITNLNKLERYYDRLNKDLENNPGAKYGCGLQHSKDLLLEEFPELIKKE